jgi:hypothetical protein
VQINIMPYQEREIAKEPRAERLDRIQTQASIVMSPEHFEQLYLSPHNKVKGRLRQTLGNPTPIGWSPLILALIIDGSGADAV